MIVCQFNLSSVQIQTLVTFRAAPDTRLVESHGFHRVDPSHTIVTMRKLCKEGYLDWFDGDKTKGMMPGYKITAKGEMMLRLVESELERSLGWFRDESTIPQQATGVFHDVACEKAEITAKGRYRRKKTA
jgi:hypothetical protein